MNTETQIYGGKVVDLLKPQKENVDIVHIANALSKQCRFNGNTRVMHTIAEHCIRVAALMPKELALYGLLHDAHEAYFGDISTPVKQAIRELTGQDPIEILADRWDEVIYPAFGLIVPNAGIKEEIKIADREALFREAENLMWDCEYWFYMPHKGFKKPLAPAKSCEKYLEMFNVLIEEKDWE